MITKTVNQLKSMVGPRPAGSLLVVFVCYLLVGFFGQFVPKAQAAASNTDIASYEVMSQWRNQCIISLKTSVTFDQYADTDYYPVIHSTNNEINVAATTDSLLGDGSNEKMGCDAAFKVVLRRNWPSSSLNGSRQAMIKEFYNTTSPSGSSYSVKANAVTALSTKVVNTLGNIYSTANRPFFRIYEKEMAKYAFEECFNWKDPANQPTASSQYDRSKYDKQKQTKTVGYLGEIYVEGSYDDGIVNCETTFEKVKAEDILSYDADAELDDMADQEYKENISAALLTERQALADCLTAVGYIGSPVDIMDELTQWLADGGSGEIRYSVGRPRPGEISATNAATLKRCLLEANEELQAAIDERPEAAANPLDPDGGNGGDDTDADPSCEASIDNPLSWIICPIYEIIQGVVNSFYTAANQVLNFEIPDDDSDFVQAWGAMRNIANVLFVIAILVLVLSQTMAGRW